MNTLEKIKELEGIALKDDDYGNFKLRTYYSQSPNLNDTKDHSNSEKMLNSFIFHELGTENAIELPFIPEMYLQIAGELQSIVRRKCFQIPK